MVAPFTLDALRGASPSTTPGGPAGDGRNGARSHRRKRSRRRIVVLGLLALLLVAASVFVGVRLRAPDPAPTVTAVLREPVHVPTRAVTLPWPTTGQAAVAVPAIGIDVASGPEQSAPVASLTKLMTAYVVLHDHPLALDAPGPTMTVTQADVDDYNHDTVNDDSNAQVTVGEQLTEAQVLTGLLVHSADNYADLVATWDAGSEAAFVAKMNAAAAALGMAHSHFADPSGVDPGSMSTASDILKVAEPDMTDPAFASMVDRTSVTLPVAGTISTFTPLIGVQGVIGVKSGFTSQAGGGDVLAVKRTVNGIPTLLLAAVIGQQGPQVLAQASFHGLALVNALVPYIGTTTVIHQGDLVAHVNEAGQTVDATAASSVRMATWPGVTVTRTFHPTHGLTDKAHRGARAGTIVVHLGDQRVVVPVSLQQDVPHPTLLQRLF
jgi:D-alanyl-D-alanine carboxypeptidase (penicillin-binding protein 5/6)